MFQDKMLENIDDDWDNEISTLATTAKSYRYENGRRYHAYRDGAYWGPNDGKDIHHQSVAHHLFYFTLEDQMLLAPIDKPRNVLDIGTGAGLWPMNFADAHPEAKVIGIDLSPIWENPIQPNLQFQVDDCCSEWTFLEEIGERFDIIHMRFLYGSIGDWPQLYKQCFEIKPDDQLYHQSHLVPDGYIEQAEMSIVPHSPDGPLAPGSVFHKWQQFWDQCSHVTGKSWRICDTMKQSIVNAGFVDVCEKRYKWPIGTWGPSERSQEIGKWNYEFWKSGMEGWVMALSTRHLGWTADQARAFVKETEEALNDTTQHVYYEVAVIYGRKPGTS